MTDERPKQETLMDVLAEFAEAEGRAALLEECKWRASDKYNAIFKPIPDKWKLKHKWKGPTNGNARRYAGYD